MLELPSVSVLCCVEDLLQRQAVPIEVDGAHVVLFCCREAEEQLDAPHLVYQVPQRGHKRVQR